MSHNKLRERREALGYTQSALAEQTNLSIRTIQRIESGKSIPKGHTLNVLSTALGIDKLELQASDKEIDISTKENLRLRLINLSALCFIGIPFGNILVPLFLWRKKEDRTPVDEVARRIINFQIIWTLFTSAILIISPFLQYLFPKYIPLTLSLGLLAMVVNVFFIIKTAFSLDHQNYDVFPLKLRFL